MIGKSIQLHYSLPESVNILNVTSLAKHSSDIPFVQIKHDEFPHRKKPKNISNDRGFYKDENVILLIREPKDVMVSLFFEKTKRRNIYKGDISEFLRLEKGSLNSYIKYYNIWAKERERTKNFMVIKYEDMHRDTEGELRRALNFLGMEEAEKETIKKSVNYARFDNMRKMEKEEKFDSDRLSPSDQEDEESYKTRKGEVGGYEEYLSKSDIEFVNKKIEREMSSTYKY